MCLTRVRVMSLRDLHDAPPGPTDRLLFASPPKTNALRIWSVTITREAMMVSWTMIRTLGGMRFRIRLMATFDPIFLEALASTGPAA